MTDKITRDMSFGDMFNNFPEQQNQIAEVLSSAGLRCLGCAAASFESIEEGLRAHGIDEAEIDAMIQKLNKIVAK